MAIDGGLRREFHSRLRHIHFVAIETGMTAQGVPDSNGCAGGVDFWIEHKSTRAWAVTFRPLQVGWIERRLRCGGRVFVAVRQLHGGDDVLWLLPGKAARELSSGATLRSLPADYIMGRWTGGPSAWAWTEVEAHLVSG